jgi:hypothetical protein
VKTRTKTPRKRKGFCGNKGTARVNKNQDVNRSVDIVNTPPNSVNMNIKLRFNI